MIVLPPSVCLSVCLLICSVSIHHKVFANHFVFDLGILNVFIRVPLFIVFCMHAFVWCLYVVECVCLCLLDNTQRSPVIMSHPAVTPCMSVWCKAAEFLAECVRQGLSDAVSHRQDECGLYREKPWRSHANQQKPNHVLFSLLLMELVFGQLS